MRGRGLIVGSGSTITLSLAALSVAGFERDPDITPTAPRTRTTAAPRKIIWVFRVGIDEIGNDANDIGVAGPEAVAGMAAPRGGVDRDLRISVRSDGSLFRPSSASALDRR